jgi:phage shock protein A
MKAQYSAAEAQVRIGEAATGLGDQMSDAGAAIQRAREKTEQMQARASALDELVESGALEDFTSDQSSLDRELAQMASQSQVEQELAAMKAQVGSGGADKVLEAGGPTAPEGGDEQPPPAGRTAAGQPSEPERTQDS